jgi:hypothetical protein
MAAAPVGGFRLQASGFRLQASGFRLQASGFRKSMTQFQAGAWSPEPEAFQEATNSRDSPVIGVFGRAEFRGTAGSLTMNVAPQPSPSL